MSNAPPIGVARALPAPVLNISGRPLALILAETISNWAGAQKIRDRIIQHSPHLLPFNNFCVVDPPRQNEIAATQLIVAVEN
jgi:hypothetical protein